MNHNKYMKLALKEADKAFKKKEVPIGAVIVQCVTRRRVCKHLRSRRKTYSRAAKNPVGVVYAQISWWCFHCRQRRSRRNHRTCWRSRALQLPLGEVVHLCRRASLPAKTVLWILTSLTNHDPLSGLVYIRAKLWSGQFIYAS